MEEKVLVYVSPNVKSGGNDKPDTKLQVKLLSSSAKLPVRSTQLSAGYDLCSAQSSTIPAWGRGLIKTDIAVKVPIGTYGRIAGRSGLALKGVTVAGGVIDRDYIGNVGVILYNFSDDEFKVNIGDRIAQLILEQIRTPEIIETQNLDNTERGAKGFGSTGV
jgi:dUTP pyrophosphatase